MKRQRQDHSMLDDSPIASLYQREALNVLAYVRRRVPIREDAADILFEVFLAALEHETIAELTEEQQRAWLFRVAHNKVVDHYRSAVRHTTLPLEDVTETLYSTAETEPDEVVFQQEEYTQLQTNLARLPTLQQEIVHLRFTVGLRYAEIARRLNKREGAIRMLLSRSLQFLRKLYKHQEDEHDIYGQ